MRTTGRPKRAPWCETSPALQGGGGSLREATEPAHWFVWEDDNTRCPVEGRLTEGLFAWLGRTGWVENRRRDNSLQAARLGHGALRNFALPTATNGSARRAKASAEKNTRDCRRGRRCAYGDPEGTAALCGGRRKWRLGQERA
ncbi:hypothetical protein TRVL_07715 [Trypanosoma vivax]|nr:hypothetical protein TRVL_07715 [Trypanosoma vivax]